MRILKFPIELFEPIIEHYVNEVGVVSAWKTRLVCKTFAQAIEYEVFGKQSKMTFAGNPETEKFLLDGAHLYLEHHSITLRDADPDVHRFINIATRTFSRYTGEKSKSGSVDWRRSICVAIAKFWPPSDLGPFHIGILSSETYTPPAYCRNLQANLLCVAIALERMDLIDKIFENGGPVWYLTSSRLGSPVTRAVETGNLRILEKLLGYFTATLDRKTREKTSCIEAVIVFCGKSDSKVEEAVFCKLVGWYCKHLWAAKRAYETTPNEDACLAMMRLAASRNDMLLLDHVLSEFSSPFSFQAETAIAYSILSRPEEAWRNDNFLVKKLLVSGLMSKSEVLVVTAQQGDFEDTQQQGRSAIKFVGALDFAVEVNDEALVRYVLQESHPEGLGHLTSQRFPLMRAVQQENTRIAEVLMKFGANPCWPILQSPGVFRCILDLCKKHSPMSKLLTRYICKTLRKSKGCSNELEKRHWNGHREMLRDLAFSSQNIPLNNIYRSEVTPLTKDDLVLTSLEVPSSLSHIGSAQPYGKTTTV